MRSVDFKWENPLVWVFMGCVLALSVLTPCIARSASFEEGSKIAIILNSDIYVMDPDGGNMRQLTHDLEFVRFPAWSPDGKKIAFASGRRWNYTEIYVMNADGTNLKKITNYPNPDFSPHWSPDGKRIVFLSHRFHYGEHIYVMNADGTLPTKLSDRHSNGSPTWSPDGKKILFSSFRDWNREIYVMNADGTGVVRLTYRPEADT